MTTTEMIQNFKLAYDIVNREGPGYEDEEILVFLNQAQTIEVLKELSLKRITFISNLVENEILSTTNPAWSVYGNHLQVSPSSPNYIGYVSSKSKVTRTTFKPTAGAEWINNILITKEIAGKYVSNNLNRAIILNPRVYEEEDGAISIIYDNNTSFSGTDDFILEYIHRPADIAIGVDSHVNLILHQRIVNTAVDLAKRVFNPQESGLSKQADQLIKNPEV